MQLLRDIHLTPEFCWILISALYLLDGNTFVRFPTSEIIFFSNPLSMIYNIMQYAALSFGLKTMNSLYLQLSTIYLLGTSVIHVAWPMVGLGLRLAQEKGLHRRKGSQKHTVEEELEKRVFWSVALFVFRSVLRFERGMRCLICIDRWMSAFLGRPCGMQDEE